MIFVFYAISIYIGIAMLYRGRKIRNTLQYATWKRVNPYSMFSKSELIIMTNDSAKIIAHGFFVKGLSTLIIVIFNLIFGVIDIELLVLLVIVLIVLVTIVVEGKAYTIYVETNSSLDSE